MKSSSSKMGINQSKGSVDIIYTSAPDPKKVEKMADLMKDPLISVDLGRMDEDQDDSEIFTTKSGFLIFLWLAVVVRMLLIQLDYANWITMSDWQSNQLSDEVMIMAKIMAFTCFFPIAVLIIIVTVDEARGKNKEPALIWA